MNSVAASMLLAQTRGVNRRDVQVLALFALGRDANDRAWLLANDRDEWPDKQMLAHFDDLIAQRLDAVPIAYLVGKKAFFGLDLFVDKRVLDPRDDTEALVEWALECTHDRGDATVLDMLDLGTGSGAIALALAHTLGARARVTATDASEAALEVAKNNAQRLGLTVSFLSGSWLQALNESPERRYDVIASNPPYIAADDTHLTDLRHEPLNALTSGIDGLRDLKIIIAEAPQHLKPSGWLLLEHGHNQSAAVRTLLDAAGFNHVQSRLDLAGIERCSGGKFTR